jgi:hypothetical protein
MWYCYHPQEERIVKMYMCAALLARSILRPERKSLSPCLGLHRNAVKIDRETRAFNIIETRMHHDAVNLDWETRAF